MKKLFYQTIVLFLGLFFSSCSPGGEYGPPPVEYGAPTAEYVLNGTVFNQQSEPISGIEIEFSNSTTYSDENGNWAINFETDPCGDSCQIVVRDIDGTENGGLYKETNLDLELTQTLESSGWYEGKFEQEDILITLEEDEGGN